jgi:hypothetical protein
MASPTEVRRAIAARLDDLDVRVTPAPVEYSTDNGLDRAQYTIRVRVGADGDPQAEELLDQLHDPDDPVSIKQRLEADRTLGGLVSHLVVIKASGYQLYPSPVPGEPLVLGATFTVQTL